MAAEPHIPDDLVARARTIRREYIDAPVIDELADEVERLREQMEMARRRVDAIADQMLAGKADGGLLGGRHLKRAVPGIFGINPE